MPFFVLREKHVSKKPERSIPAASADKEIFACLGNLTFPNFFLVSNLKCMFNFLE